MTERLIIITTCDLCQIHEGDPSPALIDAWGTVEVANRGVFVGDEEKAKENGWVEAEYGLMCPQCAKEQADQDEIDALSGVDHGATGLDALESVLSVKGEKDEPGA